NRVDRRQLANFVIEARQSARRRRPAHGTQPANRPGRHDRSHQPRHSRGRWQLIFVRPMAFYSIHGDNAGNQILEWQGGICALTAWLTTEYIPANFSADDRANPKWAHTNGRPERTYSRFFHARHSCGRATRSDHRRTSDADLSDHVIRIR